MEKTTKIKQSNLIILIEACIRTIDLFLGPFLVAYFIKTSVDSMVDLSFYKILEYSLLGLFGVLLGYIIKKNHALPVLRAGVVVRFIYILVIIFLQSDIVNHIGLIAFLHGFSAALFWLPFNIYTAKCVNNHDRTSFEVKKKIVMTSIAILGPLLLGALITSTDFIFTAVLVSVISLVQIFLSFFLKHLPVNNTSFDMMAAIKRFRKIPQVRRIMIAGLFEGITVSGGALSILITILIINSFKTDLNLGIINSVAAIATIVVCYLYLKFSNEKRDGFVILISSVFPALGVLALCLIGSEPTVIIYSILFNAFGVGLLSMIVNVRIFNSSNTLIKPEDTVEYWGLREATLNCGRIASFALMFAITIIGIEYLPVLLIFLNIFIVVLGHFAVRIKRNE